MNVNLTSTDRFVDRHVGPSPKDTAEMLQAIGVDTLDDLIDQVVPEAIRNRENLNTPAAVSEYDFIRGLRRNAAENRLYRNFIGLGYYGTIVPTVIQRSVIENPGWYTQYTPYQAEIAQGRLEALVNFQTTVADLTGMELTNASLLDEGTAAAEAMLMLFNDKNKRNKGEPINKFLVSDRVLPQTIAVLQTRAEPVGIEVVVSKHKDWEFDARTFGILLQYPGEAGAIIDYRELCFKASDAGVYVVFAADLLALTVLRSPGAMGADVVVGTTQRFGVPMGFGGPHAGYFACREKFKRQIPGRVIGVSKDVDGNPSYRMALQTREQHIKREKATSNICTAQALLAIMAGMYAVYHGPKGLQNIALRIHTLARLLSDQLNGMGYRQENVWFFDTLKVQLRGITAGQFRNIAEQRELNFRYIDEHYVGISIDETHGPEDLHAILEAFAAAAGKTYTPVDFQALADEVELNFSADLTRANDYLTHPVFHSYHSETEMMRYIKRLESRDLSLTHSMIALGSCTMKLNAASELMPITWPEFANMHPFAPGDQTLGYMEIISDLEEYLSEITGFAATSLQPNSGAQGEYSGLMVIRAYHLDRGDEKRNIVLIPNSAHGTNPASAVMAGMKVVVIPCDEMGNIEVEALRAKAIEHKDNLAGLMVTYPSTHGVFEAAIREVCDIVHENGGLVYMDGANMNAQVGLTSPAAIGADVCHLNLHKTFAIPHGGGGPGMGPICVNEKLEDYLPSHRFRKTGGIKPISSVSSAPWGSALILLISYGYIRMLGPDGMEESTRLAILNANYVKERLSGYFPILYTAENGRVGHEFIIDLRHWKRNHGIEAEDVAKRLMDYGFHAPTVSFPVAGTMMIEPTESESKAELDRFVAAMAGIRHEIDEIIDGKADPKNNVLKNAPHTLALITAPNWDFPYTRAKATYPAAYLNNYKFWPSVRRIDNSFGDRNLVCTCPPIEQYAEVKVEVEIEAV
ncbi:MAG: aminomethyl-transferring glycine dehydrogenase [Bacteroidota bacterium]